MRILVVGGGGREHAIIKSLKKNTTVEEIFAAPGNAGMGKDATCVNTRSMPKPVRYFPIIKNSTINLISKSF